MFARCAHHERDVTCAGIASRALCAIKSCRRRSAFIRQRPGGKTRKSICCVFFFFFIDGAVNELCALAV